MTPIVQGDGCELWFDIIERPFRFASPFKGGDFALLLVINDKAVSDNEQTALCKEIIEAGCRNAVCAGFKCSSWHDSIDFAFASTARDFDPPDDKYVMTTWHDDESITDVVEFLRLNAWYEDYFPQHFLVVLIGSNATVEEQILEAVHCHFGTTTPSQPARGKLTGMPDRARQIGCFAVLVLGAAVLIWAASEIIPKSRYGYGARRINEKICSLRERRPADVSTKLWEDGVAWASIAHCNICFSEEHTKYSEMLRFERDLDEKLKGSINLNTLKWIGERAAQTGPNGEQYMVKVKWREQWEGTVQAASE